MKKLLPLLLLTIYFGIWEISDAQTIKKNGSHNYSKEDEKLKSLLQACADFQMGEFRIQPYLEAAVHLQNLGEEKAIYQLENLAKTFKYEHQIIALCRILFKVKKDGEFRRPMIGGAQFLGKTDYDDWPLEPISIVNGIPFLITQGYSLAGHPEPASSYLKYTKEQCIWIESKFTLPTFMEKEKALNLLLKSTIWKEKLTKYEIQFLKKQIQ